MYNSIFNFYVQIKFSKIFQESKNLKKEEFYFLIILYSKIFEAFEE